MFGGVEGAAVDVVEDEVVEAGVEGLGDAGEGVEAGGDAPVFGFFGSERGVTSVQIGSGGSCHAVRSAGL